jgi:hypothetical protein
MIDPTEPTEDALVEARVANGARWLDEQLPGWPQMINLDRLNMTSGSLCVLGQLAPKLLPDTYWPDYFVVAAKFSGDTERGSGVRSAWGHAHGFYEQSFDYHDDGVTHDDYAAIGYVDAWTAEINKRASVTPPGDTAAASAASGAEV